MLCSAVKRIAHSAVSLQNRQKRVSKTQNKFLTPHDADPGSRKPPFWRQRNENKAAGEKSSVIPTGTFEAAKFKTGLTHRAFHKLPSGYSDVRRIPDLFRTQK